MNISLDFGGSTVDSVVWRGSEIIDLRSYEKSMADFGQLDEILRECYFGKVSKIVVTGGRSKGFPSLYNGVEVVKVGEIEAIGRGGEYLRNKFSADEEKVRDAILVVSMGTGTCMVKVDEGECCHIGGTGVGGGTFLGLAKEILGEVDVERLKEMFSKGDSSKVDLSVRDIVGGDIGIVSGDATASNLGRLVKEIDFSKSDLASGIANLIGQTIATTAVFGAKAYGCEEIVLTGKLTKIERILEVVLKVGEFYGVRMVVPEGGEYVAALGAGVVEWN